MVLCGVVALAACSSDSTGGEVVPSSTQASIEATGQTNPIEVDRSMESIEPETSTTSGQPGTTTPSPIGTSDPTVVSRRTEGIDVLVLSDGVELPSDYSQAAVPVDAFAAARLTISEVDASDAPPPPFGNLNAEAPDALDPIVDVTVDIRSCRLVAVWVLPHPDEIVVGYEEYPELTCAVPLMHTIEFEIPRIGKNSEGDWDYTVVPPVVPFRKVGPSS